MKALKVIFKILLVIVLIASIAFNVLVFSSSYGSLVFKRDENLVASMMAKNSEELKTSYLKNTAKVGYKVEIVHGSDSSSCSYYNDSDKKLTISCKFVSDSKTTYKYYRNDYLYVDDGQSKTRQTVLLETQLADLYVPLLAAENALSSYDSFTEIDNDKTSIDFSFSPFYVLGIKYNHTEDENKYTYRFDLNGDVRKVVYEAKDESNNATISVSKISKVKDLPDFSEFN